MANRKHGLLAIIGLILATTAALAAMGATRTNPALPLPTDGRARVRLAAEVVQEKILLGGDGQVAVALHLTAPRLPLPAEDLPAAADLVIVLDRSGSMQGGKLDDARQAVIRLLDRLTPDDRLALVTYAGDVQTPSGLTPVDAASRERLAAVVGQIQAGGGTNLGGGLERGIDLLLNAPDPGRRRTLILISDGLANQGLTDPIALGRLASTALESRFSISTVGVGLDFNETLMTAIADQGAGSYHFLEDPQAFARVFEAELQASRRVAAADVQIRVPLGKGVQLLGAGGYPIRLEERTALIHPGSLLSGQTRTLYLAFQVPTADARTISLGRVQVHYTRNGRSETVAAPDPLTVACVADRTAVMAGINKDAWADQVVKEEFSRLKEAVAADIRDGDKARAQTRIREYESRQTAINAVVGSGAVADNLETDVQSLRERVDETFAGAPAAVAEKKKQASKALQYDGYRMRRDKQ